MSTRYRVSSGDMDLIVNRAKDRDDAVLKALRGTKAQSLGELYSVREVDVTPCKQTVRGGARPVLFYGLTVDRLKRIGRFAEEQP